jgi:hypothetical protein
MRPVYRQNINRPETTDEFGDKMLTFGNESKYRLIGIPFYNNQNENILKKPLSLVYWVSGYIFYQKENLFQKCLHYLDYPNIENHG